MAVANRMIQIVISGYRTLGRLSIPISRSAQFVFKESLA
jgi:hypothetical protein